MCRIGYIDDRPIQFENYRKKLKRRFDDVELVLLDECSTKKDFL